MYIDPKISEKFSIISNQVNSKANIHNALGIELIHLSAEKIEATMPVDDRTKQPLGYLHGGASVVLAESIASIGAWLNIDISTKNAFGLEINANHIRPMTAGVVKGIGIPIHIGSSTQIWSISVMNQDSKLVCTSRCTIAVVDK
jgi:1,4-dihydroxy-2-naphthoyl-CoA hydrolase